MTEGSIPQPGPRRPLEGIRVVECATWHAGPGGGAILGDLGAEVIKVETLKGDPIRQSGAFGSMKGGPADMPDWNLLFEFANRNKKALSCDMNTDDGARILRRLVESADVFLTNLRPPTKRKAKIDYESISQLNPKIIHVNVNGYGAHGPMRDMGGYDPLGQAVSGMMFVTGADEPVMLQTIILDQMAAIVTSHAILTALLVRERQGIGQELNVSLYGSAIWLLHANLLTSSVLGRNIALDRDRLVFPPLRNNYQCSDGSWIMGATHPLEGHWPALCKAIGHPELEHDPRFAEPEGRRRNAPQLIRTLDGIFRTRSRDEWLEALRAGGLLFVPVQDYMDVLKDPQALENDYVVEVDHKTLGRTRVPGYPISFGANSVAVHEPAPAIGANTAEILAEMGYSPDEVAALARNGVVRI